MTASEDQSVAATFSFGQNWASFLKKCYSPERLEYAKKGLASLVPVEAIQGKTFVDIGSGSGLSSLSALDLGASRVVSFDLDPRSVETTASLREMRGKPQNWTVMTGSALDSAFLQSLGQFDVVYSWGVLHHTGRMWDAIRNASTLMKTDGLFAIAIYTTTHLTDYWIRVKKSYNRGGWFKKRLLETIYLWRNIISPHLLTPWQIWNVVRDYKKNRGMDLMTDIRDWLGGWPYEDARIEEVWRFGEQELGLRLIDLHSGRACAEYLFAGPDYLDSSPRLRGRSDRGAL